MRGRRKVSVCLEVHCSTTAKDDVIMFDNDFFGISETEEPNGFHRFNLMLLRKPFASLYSAVRIHFCSVFGSLKKNLFGGQRHVASAALGFTDRLRGRFRRCDLHLLITVLNRQALRNAGVGRASAHGLPCGVYLGDSGCDWPQLLGMPSHRCPARFYSRSSCFPAWHEKLKLRFGHVAGPQRALGSNQSIGGAGTLMGWQWCHCAMKLDKIGQTLPKKIFGANGWD